MLFFCLPGIWTYAETASVTSGQSANRKPPFLQRVAVYRPLMLELPKRYMPIKFNLNDNLKIYDILAYMEKEFYDFILSRPDLFRKLECFVKLAELGNIEAAASALGVTPSFLVRQIIALEQEIGEKLFVDIAEGLSEGEQAGHA